mmetsp:Transcript_677/g.1884  ORF Transcript_677/g.1884 Transcript_677/m.1884 type:complete len:243 (-) Transcript_677:16-744(-)
MRAHDRLDVNARAGEQTPPRHLHSPAAALATRRALGAVGVKVNGLAAQRLVARAHIDDCLRGAFRGDLAARVAPGAHDERVLEALPQQGLVDALGSPVERDALRKLPGVAARPTAAQHEGRVLPTLAAARIAAALRLQVAMRVHHATNSRSACRAARGEHEDGVCGALAGRGPRLTVRVCVSAAYHRQRQHERPKEHPHLTVGGDAREFNRARAGTGRGRRRAAPPSSHPLQITRPAALQFF